MGVTSKYFSKAFVHFFSGDIDLTSDTIKATIHSSSYTPSQSGDEYFSDVDNEVVGTGYTAGGATVTSITVTNSGTTTTFDGADVSWSTATITGRYMVLRKDTGTDSTSPLIGYVDFGEDVSSSGGTFQATWDSSGIGSVTVS